MGETKLVFLIMVLTELLFASFAAPDVAAQFSGQTVVWEWLGPPESVDPHVNDQTSGAWIIQNVYETLFSYDLDSDSAEVEEPLLAESYAVSADRRDYTFHLREGVRFHDGTPFNSSCVVFNFERLMAVFALYGPAWLFADRILGGRAVRDAVNEFGPGSPEHVSAYNTWIAQESVTALDEYTVRFRLSQPYTPFIDVIADPIGSQISPTYVQDHGGAAIGERNYWLDGHSCGTGPYMLTDLTADLVQLDVNVNYWRIAQAKADHPLAGRVSRVCIKTNAVDDSRMANLEEGVSDGCDWPVSQADRVYNGLTGGSGNGTPKSLNPDLKVWTGEPEFGASFLAFNLNSTVNLLDETWMNPFGLKELRQAVAYAFDYDRYLQNMTGGLGLRLRGPIPLGMFGHRDDLCTYQQNITTAVEKWNDAMMNGLDGALASWNYTLPIHYRITSTLLTLIPSMLVKESIESILSDPGSIKPASNLTIELVGVEWGYPVGAQLVYSMGWAPDIADPDDFVTSLIRSTSSYPMRLDLADSEGWNATQVDQWITQAAQTLNKTARAELYSVIQETIVEHCAYIYCSQGTNFHVERIEMNGYQFNPMCEPYFFHYWKTEEETAHTIDLISAAIVAASFAPLAIVLVLFLRPRKRPDIEVNQ